MKKLLIIIGIILLSLNIQAQRPYNATFILIRDSLCLGDSCVTFMMNDSTVNPAWVRAYVSLYGALPGGTDGAIQFNDAGVLGGAPMTTDGTDISITNHLQVNGGVALSSGLTLFEMDMEGIRQFIEGSQGQGINVYIDTALFLIVKAVSVEGDYESEITLDTLGFYIKVNGKITHPNPQYQFFEDSLVIGSNVIVDGYVEHQNYKFAVYMEEDSVITTSLTTDWEFIGAGETNKFTLLREIGFSFDGDSILFEQRADDLRDSVEFRIGYGCENATSSVNENVYSGIFVKSVGESVYREIPQCTKTAVTNTAAVYYVGPILTSIPLWLKDGDKIQFRVKMASGTTTLSTKRLTINLFAG